MSNDDIKNYFLHYPSIRLTWINDSSVILCFASESQAADAFFKMRVKPLDSQTMREGDDPRNFDQTVGFWQADDFKHDKFGWQTLWMRYATDMDKKSETTKGADSRFYKILESQRRKKALNNPRG